MKDRFKQLKKDVEKLVDLLENKGIYGPMAYLEEIQDLLDQASNEYEEYEG